MLRKIEVWFAGDESHAAGRLGLYRILFGIWYVWLLMSVDLQGLAARPAPPPLPIGMIRILASLGWMRTPGFLHLSRDRPWGRRDLYDLWPRHSRLNRRCGPVR